MEETTPTAQETAPATPQAQPETQQTSTEPTGTPDFSAALEAIRAQKEGRTTPQPETTPTAENATPEPAKTETTAPETSAAFKPEDFLKETSKGLINTPEDFSKVLDEYNALKTNPYAALPEAERQILEVWKQHGENPQEYFAFQAKDFKEMPAMDLLREKFAKENSHLDADLVEHKFQQDLLNKYPHLDLDDETNIDYRLALKDLERDADPIRAEFIKQQEESKIKAPEPVNPNQPTEADQKKIDDYLEAAKTKVAEFNDMKIQIEADGSEITVGIEGKEQLEKALANPYAYLDSRWLKEDGSWNVERMAQDLHILENRSSVDKQIYLAGKDAGTKTLIDEKLKNPTPLQPSAQPGSGQDQQATVAHIRQHNQKSTAHI